MIISYFILQILLFYDWISYNKYMRIEKRIGEFSYGYTRIHNVKSNNVYLKVGFLSIMYYTGFQVGFMYKLSNIIKMMCISPIYHTYRYPCI
jgi:hypothetical protein